jgi:nitrite reductase/ring-hydroxylating ferredoxin subunit
MPNTKIRNGVSAAAPDLRPVSYQEVIARDQIAPPADMREHFQATMPDVDNDKRVYISPEFHRREMDLMWPRVWQLACREEEIPEAGDLVLYELGDYSFILVRSYEGSIKCYYNSCRHRGRRLCSAATSVRSIRCPYHGFTWSLAGSLEYAPCEWDFPHLEKEQFRLDEVRVETWAGFVFINIDGKAQPLDSYLEILPDQLSANRYEERYIHGHTQQTLPANWKVVMESFMEGLHAAETHSHAWPHLSDSLQYDVYPNARHVNRSFHAVGVQTRGGHELLSEQEIIDHFHANVHLGRPPVAPPILPTDVTARRYMADIIRMQETLYTGRDYSRVSDAEALDVLQYSLFPNIILFQGISLPVVLRFRPNKNDLDSSLFDLYYLMEVPKGCGRPSPAKTKYMSAEDRHQDAGVLPDWLGYIYDQDMENIRNMQPGLKAGAHSQLTLSREHESRIRHFHSTLANYVGAEPTERDREFAGTCGASEDRAGGG